jgi:DNA invertase Pin-like site-specific DNA recombinase
MLIGYARVSKNEQNLDLQRDALLKAGCREKDILEFTGNGVPGERRGLKRIGSLEVLAQVEDVWDWC